ncbi:Zinc ribbon domain-containing protein [Gammaproteobacteria bacterium]
MPTYNYACNACDHRFEAVQKINDVPLTDCPECHRSTLKKLISVTGIVFKGTGWSRSSSTDSAQHHDTPPPSCGTGACPSCALN